MPVERALSSGLCPVILSRCAWHPQWPLIACRRSGLQPEMIFDLGDGRPVVLAVHHPEVPQVA
jgi:hypothetical protein